MSRYEVETARFDFGDDENNSVFWEAQVEIDNEYRSIVSYRVTGVHVGGKVLKLSQVDSGLRHRIEQRMGSVEFSEIFS